MCLVKALSPPSIALIGQNVLKSFDVTNTFPPSQFLRHLPEPGSVTLKTVAGHSSEILEHTFTRWSKSPQNDHKFNIFTERDKGY
jgi:hypothetical protein